MENAINRRAFLKRGLSLAGGLALTLGSTVAIGAESNESGQQPQGAGTKTRTFFAVATTRADQDTACTNHAANKLFASPEAADLNRAHPGCKCQVVKGGELPEQVWTQLFGNPKAIERVAVDRRWAWVGQTLKH
jgi:hypothetical protein